MKRWMYIPLSWQFLSLLTGCADTGTGNTGSSEEITASTDGSAGSSEEAVFSTDGSAGDSEDAAASTDESVDDSGSSEVFGRCFGYRRRIRADRRGSVYGPGLRDGL